MASEALTTWNEKRLGALGRLEVFHSTATGGLRGRPRELTELNHALFLRLASEIQGFCRELHDEALAALCTEKQIPNPDVRWTVRGLLENNRKLDSGNAGPGNIGNDWSRLGMSLWAELNAKYPNVRGAGLWNQNLAWLNLARNGIAHNDETKIAAAHAQQRLTLATFRRLRGQFTKFASATDQVTSAYLKLTTGESPW